MTKCPFCKEGKSRFNIRFNVHKIAHVVNKYGWPYVFDMYETAIHIQNSSKKIRAPKGSEEVIVDCQRNDKECFKVLGTITKDRTLPLIFLSKGSDEKRARGKYNVEKKKKMLKCGVLTQTIDGVMKRS